jgi:predicted NBD/HSP70 family sugar kinase
MDTRESVAICMDVGGTSLKSGIVRSSGSIVDGTLRDDPVDSHGSAGSILRSFASPLASLLGRASAARLDAAGICIAICGPFDYAHGISLMRGVGKYEALFGVNVKERLSGMLEVPAGTPLLFDIDSSCFARGEVWTGAGAPFSRVIVFTVGSGLGSAFSVDRRIVLEGPGVPWLGWIAGQPHRDGILNDSIGRDALMRRYRQLGGRAPDVEAIARSAREGDEAARRVFAEMGSELGAFLAGHNVEEFGAECLVFGGRISRSFDLFAGPLREALGRTACIRAILPAADIESSALRGAARYVFDGGNGDLALIPRKNG